MALANRTMSGPQLASRQAACPKGLRVLPSVPSTQSRVVSMRVAAPGPNSTDPVLKYSASIGLPTNEGLFGFKPFSELWCGRLAMMGFITSIVTEFATGRGTLAQMYLMDPNEPNVIVLALLCTVFGGATLAASADTLNKMRNKEFSSKDIARYKNFLALKNEGKDVKAAAAAMKGKPDFTTPGNNLTAINQAKAEGAPVDAFLSTNELQEAASASSEMKTSQPAAQQPMTNSQRKEVEDLLQFSPDAEMQYALNVEQTNGRWAMMGFLSAVLVEAATGKGIIMQVIMWCKFSGLLGADSGF